MSELLFKLCCSPQAYNFIKKDSGQGFFSCEFCEISKNSFFYKTPLVAASGLTCKDDSSNLSIQGPHWFALLHLLLNELINPRTEKYWDLVWKNENQETSVLVVLGNRLTLEVSFTFGENLSKESASSICIIKLIKKTKLNI